MNNIHKLKISIFAVLLIALASTAVVAVLMDRSRIHDGVRYPEYFRDFPVPQLPNSVMACGSSSSDGPGYDSVCLESKEAPEAALRFYESFLSKNQWKVASITRKAEPVSVSIEAMDPAAQIKYYFNVAKVSKELNGFPYKRFGTTEVRINQVGFVTDEKLY